MLVVYNDVTYFSSQIMTDIALDSHIGERTNLESSLMELQGLREESCINEVKSSLSTSLFTPLQSVLEKAECEIKDISS